MRKLEAGSIGRKEKGIRSGLVYLSGRFRHVNGKAWLCAEPLEGRCSQLGQMMGLVLRRFELVWRVIRF